MAIHRVSCFNRSWDKRFDVQSPDTANDVIIKLSLKILTPNKVQAAIWDLGIKE